LIEGDADLLIYHIFADAGVESEPLSAYGRVVRIGLDPLDLNDSEPIRADAKRLPVRPGADLALLHPPCQKFSPATKQNGDPDDHENLIPLAQQLGEEIADEYIIENVPNAPLQDPVTLSGKMFGLPIPFHRSFETSFHVEQPTENADLTDRSGPFTREHGQGGTRFGSWVGSKAMWRTAKQVSGDYPKETLKRSGIPAPYIHYLVRWYLRSLDSSSAERPATTATDGGTETTKTTTDRPTLDDFARSARGDQA